MAVTFFVSRRRVVAFLAAVLIVALTAGVAALEIPALSGRVVDQADIISRDAEAALTDYFARVEESSGAQVAVLTVPSLEGEALEDYSIRVVEAWELGQAGEDNGVLLFIAMQDKRVRIEVGYGLEGRLTDATSGVIIREYLQPFFRAGDYDGGVLAASEAIGSVVADVEGIGGAGTRQNVPAQRSSASRGVPFNFVVFALVFFLGSLGRVSRRRGGGLQSALFLGSMLSRGSRYHGRGGFGGGGFGGGGFGGFSGGGGGFGGGGASGGW